jgi:hypothetical protein
MTLKEGTRQSVTNKRGLYIIPQEGNIFFSYSVSLKTIKPDLLLKIVTNIGLIPILFSLLDLDKF